MRTNSICLSCFMRQAARLASICHLSEEQKFLLLTAVAGVVAECDAEASPPENAAGVYAAICRITQNPDPYREKKIESNEMAAKYLPQLQEIAARQREISLENQLITLLRLVIAGNIMDFGALDSFDLRETIDRCLAEKPVVDHSPILLSRITSLDKGAKVLYLADNCGEIIFDALLVDFLFSRGFDTTLAVKEAPIINDALPEDAYFAGLDRYAAIMTNGTACPGTPLALCSSQFQDAFNSADLIIAKGQGNFESLSEVAADIFFLLTLKCKVAAGHMAELNGLGKYVLQGNGEMAIFFSGKKNVRRT